MANPGPAPSSVGAQGERRTRQVTAWRQSLYARATLFLFLGCGAVVGAVVASSRLFVEESVDRILSERIDLAQTTGLMLEEWVRADVGHLARVLVPLLAEDPLPLAEVTAALARERGASMFGRGTFALDAAGGPLGVPGLPVNIDPAQAATAARRHRAVVSPLVRPADGSSPFIVVLAPVEGAHGRLLGFAGGFLEPDGTALLSSLARARQDHPAHLSIVDRNGLVVAGTQRDELFHPADHDEVLTRALARRHVVKGRCHTCHGEGESRWRRTTDVLAFAPLPTLDLGVAVREPEETALAPALDVRNRLGALGTVFSVLFLVFAGLSVRSVVQPVKRLTHAVRGLGDGRTAGALPALGHDEVGELAAVLERWRSRMLDSVDDAWNQRRALHDEFDAVRRHLDLLNAIALHGASGPSLASTADHALAQAAAALGATAGALRIRHGAQAVTAVQGLPADEAQQWLEQVERGATPSLPGAPGAYRAAVTSLPAATSAAGAVSGGILLGPHGVSVACALQRAGQSTVEARFLTSLLHHVGISATNTALREADRDRRALQEQYLRRMITAQEDERRRVARELHDTLAQDLAALRLELERLSMRADPTTVLEKLRGMERRAHDILVDLRRALLDLRQGVLEGRELVPVLQALVERFGKANGLRAVMSVQGEERELPYELAVTMFRVAQEGLQNVAQHAHAAHVFVSLRFEPGGATLVLEDDGDGFDPEAARARANAGDGHGLGLLGMEERARLVCGTFTVESRPGDGTTLRMALPEQTRAKEET